jgi:hypothetical protein
MKKLSPYLLPLTNHPETRGGINEKTISISVSVFLIILTITTRLAWVIKKGPTTH